MFSVCDYNFIGCKMYLLLLFRVCWYYNMNIQSWEPFDASYLPKSFFMMYCVGKALKGGHPIYMNNAPLFLSCEIEITLEEVNAPKAQN